MDPGHVAQDHPFGSLGVAPAWCCLHMSSLVVCCCPRPETAQPCTLKYLRWGGGRSVCLLSCALLRPSPFFPW